MILQPKWSTACLDWEKRIVAKQSLIAFPPLFQDTADQALEIFADLRIVDAAGQPTMGEIARPWVTDFVGSIFGSYDAVTGRRLITEYLLLISKKNGKSTDAAGIMLTALILNWRESAEFLILAPTLEVANNSYKPARDMIRADDELAKLFQVQDHLRTITHRGTGANLKVVAADSDAVSGKKATGVLVDELWLFGKKNDANAMLAEATGGLASRPEGFTIYLSTQSPDAPAGVWKQKLSYARDVRDGVVVDNRFLPVLYEFPKAMIKAGEHRNKKNFYITNPNIGLSVDVPFLEHEFDKAEREGDKALAIFLAKHMNVEVGLLLHNDGWPGAEFWLQQGRPRFGLQKILEQCEVVDVGIDGGGLDDLLGLSVLGRRKGDLKWMLWVRAWAHPSVLERRKDQVSHFVDFENDGDLVLVKSVGEDVLEVADICMEVENAGLLDKVGVDPAGIGAILDALVAAGVPEDKIVAISQGWKLHGATKTAERKLAGNMMIHASQPLMAYCAGNAKVVAVGNAVWITKQKSGSAKIDPLLATLNAVTLLSQNPKPMAGNSLFFM